MARVTITIWDGVENELNVDTDFGKDWKYPEKESDYMKLTNAQMAALGTVQTLMHFIKEGQLPPGTVLTGIPLATHE